MVVPVLLMVCLGGDGAVGQGVAVSMVSLLVLVVLVLIGWVGQWGGEGFGRAGSDVWRSCLARQVVLQGVAAAPWPRQGSHEPQHRP